MQLTPFEKAAQNRDIHVKRMKLLHKVTELVSQLKEAEDFLAIAEAQQQDMGCAYQGMYDANLIETVKKEVETITATLVIMATIWETSAGVSA